MAYTVSGLFLSGLAGAQNLQACGGEKGYPAWVKDGVYSGAIGKLPVTLQIKRGVSDQTAYFYRSYGVDLPLTAFHDGERLILQESAYNRAANREFATGCFRLGRSGAGQAGAGLQGDWTTPDARKKLAVSLAPLNVAGVPLRLAASAGVAQLRRDSPLTFLKLNRPWQKVPGGLKEPYSGLIFPRPAYASAALNAFLQDRQLKYAADVLDCRSQMLGMEDEFYFDFQAAPQFQTPHLLSLIEGGEGYCGGAHPFSMFTPYTVDKQTGKKFQPSDLWPRLTPERLLQLYSRKYKPDFEGTDGLQTMLTRHGLAIYNDNYPEFNRSVRTFDVTIPYAQLRAEADPKSPYYRDLYR
ncbi:hypothetical protein [Deinococcus sp.]|uniref:hypothetical protein n=1 Tax=Deinococcus sp. TaxID=47478 RepID=UPI0025BE799A|nr:hypothetical protein [Deinococcus sp.]